VTQDGDVVFDGELRQLHGRNQ